MDVILWCNVFMYLEPKDVLNCSQVSVLLNLAGEFDEYWQFACVKLWIAKTGMRQQSITSNPNLFPKIRISECGLKQLKRSALILMLHSRNIEFQATISNSEMIRLLIASTPLRVQGWNIQYRNIWKASLMYSISDSKRVDITAEELLEYQWAGWERTNESATFKIQFKPKQRAYLTRRNGEQSSIFWKFVHYNPRCLQYGSERMLTPKRRHSDWGWIFESDDIILVSQQQSVPRHFLNLITV